jgi:uncharacterized protein (TIGR03083 family)
MTSTADRMIEVLRSEHEWLAAFVAALDDAALIKISGASEWTVAMVLSHLGSGAEITLATLEVALTGVDDRGADFNQSVWDTWNAKAPAAQAQDFVTVNDKLVARYESIDDATRDAIRIDLGFLPQPLDLATAAGLRLSEFAHHSWDVRVAFDPAVTLSIASASLLIDQFGLLFGWLGHGDLVEGRHGALAVRTIEPDRYLGVELGDKITLTEVSSQPDAVLTITAEAWLRLIAGRLAPENTPSTTELTGELVSLDDLRRAFPGF